MKLIALVTINTKIKLLSGLHIGAGKEETQIGGLDNPVVRLQKNGYPYIPGSSIKGKMRSLLELYHGKFIQKNNNLEDDNKDDNEKRVNIGGVHKFEKGKCDNLKILALSAIYLMLPQT